MAQASEISRSPELKASHERLLAAWQAALPLIFPALKVHFLRPFCPLCFTHQASRCLSMAILKSHWLRNPHMASSRLVLHMQCSGDSCKMLWRLTSLN